MYFALLLSGMVFWVDPSEGPSTGLAAVRYEWRANTYGFGAQDSACLDVLPDGSLVIVWASRRQDGGFSSVHAQRFAPHGILMGEEFSLSEASGLNQRNPAVAAGPSGELWFTWEAFGRDGDGYGIVARRFDPAGVPDPEFTVNQNTHGAQIRPTLAVSADGTAAIAWSSAPRGEPGTAACYRVFGPHGAPLCDERAVRLPPAEAAGLASIRAGADGNFGIAVAALRENDGSSRILLQTISPNGVPRGSLQVVGSGAETNQAEPVIEATCSGYIVAWHEYTGDTDSYDIFARRTDSDGLPIDAPIRVHQLTAASQNGAAVSVAPDGRVCVAWNTIDGADRRVIARWFDENLEPLTDEFGISGPNNREQALAIGRGTRRLATLADGGLVCAWNGDAGLGDRSGVNVTLLSAEPLVLGGGRQGVWEVSGVAPAGWDGLSAEPHRPPTFRPNRVARRVQREIQTGAEIGFSGIADTGWDPPDPILAAGPKHLVVMTNGGIAFYRKDGTEDFFDEIDGKEGFWGELGVTNFVFDPEVLYDPETRRFFAICVEAHVAGERSFLLLAVSDDSDPNGDWFKYRVETTELSGDVLDSPNLAVDSQALYVTGDGHGRGGNYPMYVFEKAALINGDDATIVNAFELETTTQSAGIPSLSFDAPALYMIEHQEGGRNRAVRLIALRGALETPSIDNYELVVPSYGEPEDPEHKSGAFRLETFDARFWSVFYRNGSLWATHHVDSNHVVARWYQIEMNGWPVSGDVPTLLQTGEIKPSSRVRTFFSAIAVDKLGNAAMTFARTSPTDTVSMSTVFRLVDDPAGTFRDEVIHKSSGELLVFSRWGDYAGIRVDPADGRTFWAIHEYAEKFEWRTWIVGFNPTFDLGDLNCDGGVDFADIDPFVLALGNSDEYRQSFPDCDSTLADVNADGSVDFDDIDPFVELLIP